MNAILKFKEPSIPNFTAHAPTKREELKAQAPPNVPHLSLISKELQFYQLNAAALDIHYQGGHTLDEFFSRLM